MSTYELDSLIMCSLSVYLNRFHNKKAKEKLYVAISYV